MSLSTTIWTLEKELGDSPAVSSKELDSVVIVLSKDSARELLDLLKAQA